MKSNTPVDFSDPKALEAELTATPAPEEKVKKAKAPKEAKPRVIKVKYTADKAYAAGDIVEFDYTLPKSEGIRGQVAGIPLTEMTDDQLKIEYRNANSVNYKTGKAKRDTTHTQARVDAVKAVMEDRGIAPTGRVVTATLDAKSIADSILSGKINIADIQALLDAVPAATEQK